jgi:catechol 2,3-dioxygenase-like lactoylglutathione lyase family enzyme
MERSICHVTEFRQRAEKRRSVEKPRSVEAGMKLLIAPLVSLLALSAALIAQAPEPNRSGVSVSLVHLIVRDPEAHKKLWVDMLGAQVTSSGSLELLKLPGLFVTLEKGEPTGPSNGSSVNHIGLWIKDYDTVKAKVSAAQLTIISDGYKAEGCAAAPATPACQMTIVFPDGVVVEFTEDKQLTGTAASHHIHMQTTDPQSLRAWYANTLGATAGFRRGTIMAALFERGEVDFHKAAAAPAPTQGRAIDHFGLEVKGLAALLTKLEAAGVKVETAAGGIPGTKSAFITDPAGARIALIEGLPAN